MTKTNAQKARAALARAAKAGITIADKSLIKAEELAKGKERYLEGQASNARKKAVSEARLLSKSIGPFHDRGNGRPSVRNGAGASASVASSKQGKQNKQPVDRQPSASADERMDIAISAARMSTAMVHDKPHRAKVAKGDWLHQLEVAMVDPFNFKAPNLGEGMGKTVIERVGMQFDITPLQCLTETTTYVAGIITTPATPQGCWLLTGAPHTYLSDLGDGTWTYQPLFGTNTVSLTGSLGVYLGSAVQVNWPYDSAVKCPTVTCGTVNTANDLSFMSSVTFGGVGVITPGDKCSDTTALGARLWSLPTDERAFLPFASAVNNFSMGSFVPGWNFNVYLAFWKNCSSPPATTGTASFVANLQVNVDPTSVFYATASLITNTDKGYAVGNEEIWRKISRSKIMRQVPCKFGVHLIPSPGAFVSNTFNSENRFKMLPPPETAPLLTSLVAEDEQQRRKVAALDTKIGNLLRLEKQLMEEAERKDPDFKPVDDSALSTGVPVTPTLPPQAATSSLSGEVSTSLGHTLLTDSTLLEAVKSSWFRNQLAFSSSSSSSSKKSAA